MMRRPLKSTLFPYTTLFRSIEIAKSHRRRYGIRRQLLSLQQIRLGFLEGRSFLLNPRKVDVSLGVVGRHFDGVGRFPEGVLHVIQLSIRARQKKLRAKVVGFALKDGQGLVLGIRGFASSEVELTQIQLRI